MKDKTRKEQLYTELATLEAMIAIYSAEDMIRVEQLQSKMRPLEMELLDILNDENDAWLDALQPQEFEGEIELERQVLTGSV